MLPPVLQHPDEGGDYAEPDDSYTHADAAGKGGPEPDERAAAAATDRTRPVYVPTAALDQEQRRRSRRSPRAASSPESDSSYLPVVMAGVPIDMATPVPRTDSYLPVVPTGDVSLQAVPWSPPPPTSNPMNHASVSVARVRSNTSTRAGVSAGRAWAQPQLSATT